MNSQHMIKEVCICKMNLIERKSKRQGKKKEEGKWTKTKCTMQSS